MDGYLNCKGRSRGRPFLFAVIALAIAAAPGVVLAQAERPACQNLPPCKGCGCRGGPGYRGPDGHCVGYKQMDAVCGKPPTRCKLENAPNSGVNRACVLGPATSAAGA